jgi:hypothetical protein
MAHGFTIDLPGLVGVGLQLRRRSGYGLAVG